MSRLYGWGASLVIIGALFKIMHWPWADYALIIGMGVEAVVFFFSAFENVPEEPDWKLVYPELAGGEPLSRPEARQISGATNNITLSSNLDKLMEQADIGPELINKLSRGLRNLSDNASRLADLSNATIATNQYIANMETASKSVLELSQSYKNKAEYLKQDLSLSEEYNATLQSASQSLSEMGEAYRQSASKAKESLYASEDMTKNLSALNTAYEMQIKAAAEQTSSAARYEETIENIVSHLNNTAESARKYNAEMERLNENMKALNNVYGNMLSAMNVSR
ncbi:MAG: gliding motility protein GldL [Bacteroidales bacterium]|nr:gliding motility protein GldL [Bacteroidales bacterium]